LETTMKYTAFVRTAAMALMSAAAAGAAMAENAAPTPPVMTDTAPLPPQERSSMGAIEEQPVLAKRAYLEALAASQSPGVDTRSMGAGPARVMRRELTKAELEALRAGQAADLQKNGGQTQTPK
jgi:hypothetical protein